jgi:hypothetical protein
LEISIIDEISNKEILIALDNLSTHERTFGNFEFMSFSIYFKNLIRIYLNLDFGLLRSCLANGVDA